jgi:hypothetical protein
MHPSGCRVGRSKLRQVERGAMSTEISTKTMGLHAVEVAFSGVAWFVAAIWLNSIGGPWLGLTLVIVMGMSVMAATLLLLAISVAIEDPRWRQGECRCPARYRPYPPSPTAQG